MGRFLAGRPVTLTHTLLDDETVLHPDSVAVTVTRAGSMSPTVEGEATPDGDVYTFTAGMLPEGVYTVRWDGGVTAVDVTTVEVVGGFLFSVPALRASEVGLTADRFPAAEVAHYRTVTEVEFETITGRSFTPRTAFLRAEDAPAEGELLPYVDVRSVTILGPSDGPVDAPIERIERYAFMPALPDEAIGVEIAYGFTAVPADIRRVGMLRTRWHLMAERSAIPDRATSYQPADGGTYLLATPGRAGYHTGVPDVDAVLDRYRNMIIESVGVR